MWINQTQNCWDPTTNWRHPVAKTIFPRLNHARLPAAELGDQPNRMNQRGADDDDDGILWNFCPAPGRSVNKPHMWQCEGNRGAHNLSLRLDGRPKCDMRSGRSLVGWSSSRLECRDNVYQYGLEYVPNPLIYFSSRCVDWMNERRDWRVHHLILCRVLVGYLSGITACRSYTEREVIGWNWDFECGD